MRHTLRPPAQVEYHTVDLGNLDSLVQYATMAWAQITMLKKIVCEPEMPQTSITLTLDLNRVPRFERISGEMPGALERPGISLRRLFNGWMTSFGLAGGGRDVWVSCDSQRLHQLSALLLYAAYLFDSGLLHNFGYLLHVAAVDDWPLEIWYDASAGELGLKLAAG